MLIHREQNWSRVWCSWNGIRTVATRSRVLFERSFAVPCCYCTDSFETISLTCEASGFPHSLFELLQDFVGIDEQIWSLGTAEIRDPGSLQPALKHLTPLLTSSLTEIPAQWSRDTFSNCFTWSLRFFHMSGSPKERDIYISYIHAHIKTEHSNTMNILCIYMRSLFHLSGHSYSPLRLLATIRYKSSLQPIWPQLTPSWAPSHLWLNTYSWSYPHCLFFWI